MVNSGQWCVCRDSSDVCVRVRAGELVGKKKRGRASPGPIPRRARPGIASVVFEL